MKKFSVLMSVYFKENPVFLQEALKSVIEQTLRPSEIVLIKDGHLTDELENVINQFLLEYGELFTIIVNEENIGLGKSLAKGVTASKYDIIARMDSDDIADHLRFEKEMKILDEYDIDVVGSNIAEFIDNIDNVICYRDVPENNDEISKYLKKRCPFNHMTVMYKKKAVLDAGNYLDLLYNEDYYLWTRMFMNRCKFYNIQENLVYARISNSFYGRRGGRTYYSSEKFLQKYMKKNKIINSFTYHKNVFIRFVIQMIVPNFIRKVIYQKLLRKNKCKI